MKDQLILLDKQKIIAELRHKDIELHIFQSIDSTNHYLKNYLNTETPTVCIAEQQAHGRGRFNRHWHSPFGQNIYLSLLYRFKKDMNALAGLSLIISLAIVDTLSKYDLTPKPLVKWPNDVMIDNKKVSGNLIEITSVSNGICAAIIGVGINVNMLDDNEHQISKEWTSLRLVKNHYFDRNILCAQLIDTLILYIQKFEAQGLIPFLEEWQSLDFLYHKNITLNLGAKKITGKAQGITEKGYLKIQLEDGTVMAFSSGDATLSNISSRY